MKAQTIATELKRELERPEPLPKLTLWDIERQLAELLDARDQAQADGALPEEITALDGEIDRYVAAEIRKVDGVCGFIHWCEASAELAKREEERLHALRQRWEDRMARVKASALAAMQRFEVRVLETATNRLRAQNNGGQIPLEVDTVQVKADYMRITVTISYDDWLRFLSYYPHAIDKPGVRVQPAEINQVAVRAALSRGETVTGVREGQRGQHLRVE